MAISKKASKRKTSAAREAAGQQAAAMTPRRRSDPPGYYYGLLTLERGVAGKEMTVRLEDTLRAAGISSKRQLRYQRRMSGLLAGGTDGRAVERLYI
jgi:hypothetical protein